MKIEKTGKRNKCNFCACKFHETVLGLSGGAIILNIAIKTGIRYSSSFNITIKPLIDYTITNDSHLLIPLGILFAASLTASHILSLYNSLIQKMDTTENSFLKCIDICAWLFSYLVKLGSLIVGLFFLLQLENYFNQSKSK